MSPKDHVAVRLDNATLLRIDALKEVLSTPWHEATRSDILRALILTGLEHLEREHGAALAENLRREQTREEPGLVTPRRGAVRASGRAGDKGR